MTYNEIVRELKKKIKYYISDIYKSKEYEAMCFYEKYSNTNVRNMFEIDLGDLVKIMLIKLGKYNDDTKTVCVLLSTLPRETIIDIINDCYNSDPIEYADFFVTFLKQLVKDDEFDFAGEDFSEISKIFTDIIYAIINDKDSLEVIKGLLQYNCLDTIQAIDKERTEAEVRQFIGTTSRTIKRMLKSSGAYIDLNEVCKRKEFVDTFNGVKKFIDYAYLVSNGLTTKKIRSNSDRYSKVLSRFLECVNKKDMTECVDEVSRLDDPELIKNIYLFIEKHNKPYFDSIEKEYADKSANMEIMYVDYFRTKGLDFNRLSDNFKRKIMEDSIEVINAKIKIICNFVDKNNYFQIIAGSSMEVLDYLYSCIKKSIIDYDFIKDNIRILIDSDMFDKFKTNLLFLMDNVNVKKFKDKSFLLADIDIIRANIALLSKYEIPFKNCTDFSFIKEPIKEKICLFVEVGLEDEIYNNPDILNSDIDLAKRVLLTQMVGEDIYEDGKISRLLINKSDFFVKSSKVDMMLERDNTKYNSGSVFYLSNEEATRLSYVVDGVIIAKPRIKEQPVSLVDIVRPSLYSEEQIKILEKNSIR